MRYALCFFVLLAGCATEAEQQAAFDQVFDQCAMVFKPGTPEHYGCVEHRLGIDRPAYRRPTVTECKPDGVGGVRCSTR